MKLKTGQATFELPPFDRLEKIVFRAENGVGYELEPVMLFELERFKNQERDVLGPIRGRPTIYAIKHQTVHLCPVPAVASTLDIVTWHRVTT